MRILFIVHQFFPEFTTGTERVTLNLAKAAQRAGHYAHVLACVVNPGPTGSDDRGLLRSVYHGIPLTLIPRNRLLTYADIGFDLSEPIADTLTQWIARERFDVAHVLHTMRMAAAVAALRRGGVPYVVTLTDFFAECYRINLIDAAGALCDGPAFGARCGEHCLVAPWTPASLGSRYRQAHAILADARRLVCPSEFVAARYQGAFPDLRFIVIPHGIDALAGASRPPDVDGRGVTLGYAGSFIPQKGLDTLLRALAYVPDAEVTLRICGGGGGDANYARQLEDLVRNDERVEFLGQLPSAGMPSFLASLDVLCVPSRVPETFSLALHEASAVAVPALVSDLGAPGAFVSRHGCGRALPPDDPGAWAQAIRELLSDRHVLQAWRNNLPLPLRSEEEAFFYQSLYLEALAPADAGAGAGGAAPPLS
jgi:glycosyltransferase involved in cell wall biosynthesis